MYVDARGLMFYCSHMSEVVWGCGGSSRAEQVEDGRMRLCVLLAKLGRQMDGQTRILLCLMHVPSSSNEAQFH